MDQKKNLNPQPNYEHFKGKDAARHVVEAQAKGLIDQAESHGTEPPSLLSSACDSLKETAFLLLLLFVSSAISGSTHEAIGYVLIFFSIGLMMWKMGRSAMIAWGRIERLDKVLEEERYEIQHNTEQEREELRALYNAKGFEGKLLDRVVDVLMADENRLLKVMLEEELGLRLGSCEHPLKMGLASGFGSFFASLIILPFFFFGSPILFAVAGFFVLGTASLIAARYEKNDLLSSVVWNLSIAATTLAALYLTIK